MKKFISILVASVMAASVLSIFSASAAEEDSEIGHTLDTIAASFGAETDYFVFPNRAYMATANTSNSCYVNFLRNISNAGMFSEPECNFPEQQFSNSLFSGLCYGISVLEILNHNGYITPSDLQDDAESLTDVIFDENTKEIVSYYQVSQHYTPFDLYFRWNVRTYSETERVKQLLSTADKATNEGKYFLIIEDSKNVVDRDSDERFSHAVAGIGITEGDWTFNGEHFDKCILTLDSNVLNGKYLPKLVAYGFAEEGSIFINSQTYQAYIPGYELGEDDDLNFFSLDDETLLNYYGLVNPCEGIGTDISGINRIDILSDGDYSIYADDFDGETFDVINSSYKKDYEDSLKSYYAKGENFTVNNLGTDFSVNISDFYRTFKVKSSENARSVLADTENVTVTANGSEMDYAITKIENMPTLPYYFYEFKGKTDSNITISTSDDGIVLSGENGVECSYDFAEPDYDDSGILVTDFEQNFSTGIISSSSVMLKYEDGRFIPYVDNDMDNAFETKVAQGDTNCDNIIDTDDAFVILSGYASVAVQNPSYCNDYLGDFNNDGSVDAEDAYQVLLLYAQNSVG